MIGSYISVVHFGGVFMSFIIIRQDITKLHVDAIVNAANTDLAMGSGVCGAIFKAAGIHELHKACVQLAPISTGKAAITPAFNLPATYIIHAVGPIYPHWNAIQNQQLLYSAYIESLQLALQVHCKSIAFPLISSGYYGYPKKEALQVATSAIKDFLVQHDMDIYLVIFDKESFSVSEKLLGQIDSYIDETYVHEHLMMRKMLHSQIFDSKDANTSSNDLDRILHHLDDPFNTALLRLIDEKNKTDVEVYRRANLDRKLFSKIRIGKGYLPSKRTVLALAIALELTLEETEELLKKAGYALSHSQKFDVILEYFIINRNYDIFEINEILFHYDLPLLGSN